MIDSIKHFSFSDIEILFQTLDKLNMSLLELQTERLKIDLELITLVEELKVQLANLISVK